MIFTAFDFPVVVFEGMMSPKGLKSGGNAMGYEIPGFMGENTEHMSFARSLESSLEGMFSAKNGGFGEEIAENSNADVTAVNESDPGNADILLSLLIESARTAQTPDESQFDHKPGGSSASKSGGMIGEILSKILKVSDPENPGLKRMDDKNTNGKTSLVMDRHFPGSHHGNDTLQAFVEKFGQGAAKSLAVEDGETHDRLRHLIASLSKPLENSDSQIRHVGKPITDGLDLRQTEMTGNHRMDMQNQTQSASNDPRIPVQLDETRYPLGDSNPQIRHVGKPITDGPDLRQTEMTGNLRMELQNQTQSASNDPRNPVQVDETRDSLKERTAVASEKADAHLRGFLNSLTREAGPRNQGPGDSRGRSGSKMSGFKGSEAGLDKERSILKNIASVGPGGVFPLGKGGAASLMEFNLQSTFSDGTGERSGEKPVASPLDTARPAASFEKSLQQPMENKIVGQVFMRLFSGARQGSGNMTINIYPPEMGSVRIRIISDHGRLTVHMHPGNPQVAGILEKNLGVLQQSLADQGLDVSDLFVSVDTGEQGKSDFEQQALMHGAGKKGVRAGEKDALEDQNTTPPASHDPWVADGHTLSLRV